MSPRCVSGCSCHSYRSSLPAHGGLAMLWLTVLLGPKLPWRTASAILALHLSSQSLWYMCLTLTTVGYTRHELHVRPLMMSLDIVGDSMTAVTFLRNTFSTICKSFQKSCRNFAVFAVVRVIPVIPCHRLRPRWYECSSYYCLVTAFPAAWLHTHTDS